MMQPTPAPSSPPRSETVQDDIEETTVYHPPPQNIGSAPFSVLVSLFMKLQSERKPERRRQYLNSWFNHWRREKGYDLYPVLRLILPQKDRERAVYGLKEKNLAKTYIKLIPLGPRDPDALQLLYWKKPVDRPNGNPRYAATSSGDFPNVLHDVVKKRSSVIEGSLSVDDLNDILDELSKNMGKGEIQSKILQRVYNRATAEEQRWIVRIILKDMVISVKETTVFSVFHPDAQDLYNTCSDLKKVAWELWDPARRLNDEDKQIQLFRAFAPMLCKRPTKKIEDSVKEMGGVEFIVEEKLDGERMQLHKRGNEYFYCSRKGKDYTYLYGSHVGTGSLTPFINAAFDPRIESIVLDGEMLVWDPISERNLPFGTLKTAALDKSKKEHNPRPCFKIFDLLYLNDQSLLNTKASIRKKNMRKYVKEIKGRIEYTTEFRAKTAKDVRERMDQVMADRGEGLVMKQPASAYVLNGRNNDWIKVKPEYMDNMGETVDVLVVAGNYGSGKRAGGVSTLVCAVFDDKLPDEEEPKYSTFVRIGSGLSFADYVWIRAKPWKTWDPNSPPTFLETASKSHDDKGDVYLEPEDSFILKVKAAEITKSDQYHMGYTMRFPRALSIRDDLTIGDCLKASDITESIILEKKRKMENQATVSNKKQKRVIKKPEVLGHKGPKASEVTVENNIFEGMNFVVYGNPQSRTAVDDKNELVKSILAHGGKSWNIVRDQENLFVVYGGTKKFPDIKRVIDKEICDIVLPQWILDCIRQGQLVPLSQKYLFYATPQRMKTDEYNLDQADVPMNDPDAMNFERPQTLEDKSDEREDEGADVDPILADWFKVDQNPMSSGSNEKKEISDTETEADSDNADVRLDEDDWLNVEPTNVLASGSGTAEASTSNLQAGVEGKDESADDVRMGEDNMAMDYDQDMIFKHLCFYLDSPNNARKNDMVAKSKHESEIIKNFAEVSTKISENGGKVVDLDDSKLTHVVVDRLDASRRLKLIERTSKPKRRRLVIAEWVRDSLEEQTLLDEEEYAP